MRHTPLLPDAIRGACAPRAEQEECIYELHGEVRRDEFAYLRRPGDQRTERYIAAENEYFRTCFSPLTGLRDSLYVELKSRIIEYDASVPEIIDGYRYYTKVQAGRQYPVHCRRADRPGSAEEVYLDENLLAGSGRYCDVSIVALCPRRQTVAYSVDRSGDERYDVFAARIPDGEHVRCATDVGDSIAWSGDGRYLLYTGLDDKARPDSVWVYDTTEEAHQRIFVETDAAFHVTVWLSRSGEWIFIDSASNVSSETLVLPAGRPLDEPKVLIPRRDEIEYTVDHHDGRFLILTNDTAETFRLAAMPASAEGVKPLAEVIAPDAAVTLEFVDAYRSHWIVGELHGGTTHIAVRAPESGAIRYLPGSGLLTHLDVEDLYDYGAGYVRYEYSTPVTPHTTYDFDVASGALSRRKTTRPPGYDENAYICERVDVPSSDGVRVPLTLLRRKDTPLWGGEAPVLLTGYGAYEQSVDMEFDSDLVSLLDRGVVAASAHVRGGGDLGPAWHDAGRLAGKENSFADFLACARYLIDNGCTSAGRIAAWGASAGGLLVAVAAQRAPELFASIVLEVPFLDVVNTLLDPGLPLTEHDFDEFGNPAVDEEFLWLRAYSPYDNIRRQTYPPMLVTTAMNDQRVGYWEAVKWTARLRAMRSDDNPLLLRVDETGHFGESGRYETARDTAVIYAFMLDMWGLAPERRE